MLQTRSISDLISLVCASVVQTKKGELGAGAAPQVGRSRAAPGHGAPRPEALSTFPPIVLTALTPT